MRNGFTLIELLVVIAIITLLLAVGTPSIRHTMDFAGLIGCASNFRQVGLAFQGYTADNSGKLPGPNWRKSNGKGWLYSNLQMDSLEGLESGLLWPYINEYSIYRCPDDDTDPETVPNRPNNSRVITSYCMNGSVCAYGARAYDSSTGYWDSYKWIDFDPMDVVLWETDETRSGGWWHDAANFPWEGITGRHLDRGNTVCADGHAEWMLVDDYYKLGANSAPGPNRLWNTPGTWDGRRNFK